MRMEQKKHKESQITKKTSKNGVNQGFVGSICRSWPKRGGSEARPIGTAKKCPNHTRARECNARRMIRHQWCQLAAQQGWWPVGIIRAGDGGCVGWVAWWKVEAQKLWSHDKICKMELVLILAWANIFSKQSQFYAIYNSFHYKTN